MQANSWCHNYSSFILPFPSGKCRKDEKKYKYFNISRAKKAFFMIFENFSKLYFGQI